MTTATRSAQDPKLAPDAGPTPEQVVGRAEAIAATLVERQAETERRTFYDEAVHEELRQAGLYRILVPRSYGGLEFGVETFLKVCTALARGCPSTGWMYCFGAAHALPVATLFDERAQAELFAGTDFICPATVAPAGSAVRTEDGGWLLNGVWSYCSGAPYATHFLGHCLVPGDDGQPPQPMMFVIERDQWQRLDDWGQQLGLRGSGSHSISISDGYLPAHFALPATHLSQIHVDAATPGQILHGNPQYGGGPLSFMLLEPAALAVGMARGALDVYEDLMRSRKTVFFPFLPRTEDPDYQLSYGQASGMINAAEAALHGAARQWQELCAQGPAAFDREQDLRIATISREVIGLCWRAVEGQLFRTAGSSAVRNGERMERIWRDMSMIHTHAGFAVFLSTHANRELAKAHFGVE